MTMSGRSKIPRPAKGLPQSVLDCYYKRMKGCTRVVSAYRDGAVSTATFREEGIEGLAARDVEALKALVSDGEAIKCWAKMEGIVGSHSLPVLFDALWQAKLDWESLRKDNGETRLVAAKKISEEIAQTALEIERLFDALDNVVSPLGNIGFRHSDQWPDSPSMRNELARLKERCDSFQTKGVLSSFAEVNAALSGRKMGGEYARALVRLLEDAGAMKIEIEGFKTALVELARLVDPDTDTTSISNAMRKNHGG